MKRFYSKALGCVLALIALSTVCVAQTTAFNFQGRLNDGGAGANGNYDLRFKLFDAITGGTDLGSIDRLNSPVINGIFSTALDFGPLAFQNVGNRFIEIAVRPAGSQNAFVVLGGRQQILAVPYSVRAMTSTNADSAVNATTAQNSLSLNGLSASNYARLNTSNSGELIIDGNIRQSLNANGAVKAMAHVNSDTTIAKCYNSVTNSTTIPCGISVSRFGGLYRVDFSFQVFNRFVSVTPFNSGLLSVGANITTGSPLPNRVTVIIFDPYDEGGQPETSFMIIIY
jgi:hypothetical protein